MLTLGFRRQWQYPDRWASELAARLGLHAEVHETGGAKGAAAALDAQLDRGLPAIAWVDPYQLGLRGLPPSRDGFGGPPVVVYERAGDTYAIDDRSRRARRSPRGARRRARPRRLLQAPADHARPELVDLSHERLRDAVLEGLRLQVEHLSASSSSFSLPAWRKWARMTTDARNAKGWPVVFADGRGIAGAMASIYTGASGGAHLRGLYASFLDDAADLLARPALRDAAAAWREAAAAWDVIVDTALPPGDELRALIDTGEHETRWALQTARDEAWELPSLTAPVTAMYEAEVAALARLQQAGS